MSRKLSFILNNAKCIRQYSKKSNGTEQFDQCKRPITQLDPEVVIYKKRVFTEKDAVPKEEKVGPEFHTPEEYRTRRVARISQRSKNVMQQGTNNTKEWILEFENEQRWENPTIGWTSSGDSLSNIYMEFPSLDSAIHFAERNGLSWYHDKPHVRREVKKTYADIFSWNKRTRSSTK